MRNRTEEINVRVYKTEKNTIRRKAKKCGMNMSEYLRTLGTGTAVKEAPRRELMLAYQKLTTFHDSVVTPNNNRYYYVYEYTNYKGPKCFTVSASDAAEEAAFRAVVTTGIGALAGYYAGGNMTVTKFTADMLDRLLPQSPTYRAGYYKVYARDKIKYQVDSLDPSKRVVVDRWSCLKYELYESENSTTLKDSSEFILHEK